MALWRVSAVFLLVTCFVAVVAETVCTITAAGLVALTAASVTIHLLPFVLVDLLVGLGFVGLGVWVQLFGFLG